MAKRRTLDPARADRFVWEDGDITWSQCIDYGHKHSTEPPCTAFPAGIPLSYPEQCALSSVAILW